MYKLIQYLQACSPEELDRLGLFLRADFHNTDRKLVHLFDHLRSAYPDFPPSSYSKSVLHELIYPGKAYDDKKVRYGMSDLCKLIERFWALEAFTQDQALFQLSVLDELSRRKQGKGYRQLRRQWQKQDRSPSVKNLWNEYRFQAIEQDHFLRLRIREFDDRIQRAADALDRFYFLGQLVYACGMLDRQEILQGEYQSNLSADWLSHLEARNFFAEPLIHLYFTIFQMLKDEDKPEYFGRLKQQLLQNELLQPSDTLRDAYLFAINYCARKIRRGEIGFLAEALTLYEEGIKRRVLFDQGELSPWTFTNVVKLALRLQRHEWIEDFIDRYGEFLPEPFRDNALHYNLAELYYYTQRYEEAQLELNQVAFSDLNYYLGARVLLAKVYFETDEIEPLLSLLSAFIIFLKRNRKISSKLKQTYLNFCHFLFQIIKNRPKKREQLREAISNTELLTDRAWLLEKLAQQKPV